MYVVWMNRIIENGESLIDFETVSYGRGFLQGYGIKVISGCANYCYWQSFGKFVRCQRVLTTF